MGVWLGVAQPQECTRGPEDSTVIMAGPCHTPDPILLWWGQDKCSLQTIGISVIFLPLDESIIPVFLTEVCQFVHCGHTKVDHNGVGTGFGEAAEAYKHSCHFFAHLGLWDIILPSLTAHRVFLCRFCGSSSLSSHLLALFPISSSSLDP